MKLKRPKHLTKILIFAASILLVVTGILALTYNQWGLHPFSTPNTTGNQELLHGTVIIDNGSYYLQFIVPENALNIHVTGNYSVQTNSPIRLYIMDQNSFEQWRKQSNFNPNFNNGESTNGDVNATLSSSGVYYVLFENSNQSIQPLVAVELKLSYWQT